MNEICAAARALAVLLAVVSVFITVPLTAPLLLLFGGIAAIKNDSERNTRNFIITLVLLLGAPTLVVIPLVGPALVKMFASLAIAFVGASMVAIVITLALRIKRDWVKA